MTTLSRENNRALDKMRNLSFQRKFLEYAEGSCLVQFGRTKVLCTASVDDRVPPFLIGSNQGWLTAEYAMLPKSTKERTPRERNRSGRSQEIQRLIGRSLRCVTNLDVLGERTIYIDCDVIQADGGTRTAAISGAAVALYDACKFMLDNQLIRKWPLREMIAAVSVGLVDNQVCLDLDYSEDSNADVDFNVVKTESGKFVELQGTAEQEAFSNQQLSELLDIADRGITEILRLQKECLQI